MDTKFKNPLKIRNWIKFYLSRDKFISASVANLLRSSDAPSMSGRLLNCSLLAHCCLEGFLPLNESGEVKQAHCLYAAGEKKAGDRYESSWLRSILATSFEVPVERIGWASVPTLRNGTLAKSSTKKVAFSTRMSLRWRRATTLLIIKSRVAPFSFMTALSIMQMWTCLWVVRDSGDKESTHIQGRCPFTMNMMSPDSAKYRRTSIMARRHTSMFIRLVNPPQTARKMQNIAVRANIAKYCKWKSMNQPVKMLWYVFLSIMNSFKK